MYNVFKLSAIAALCSIASLYSNDEFYNAQVVRNGSVIDSLPYVKTYVNENGMPLCFYLKTDGTQDVMVTSGDQIKTSNRTYTVTHIKPSNNYDRIEVTLKVGAQAERDIYAHRNDSTVRRYTKN